MRLPVKPLIGALLIALPCLQCAIAQTVIYPAHIVEVATGWDSDDMGVSLDQPVVNPAHCPTTDYYMAQGGLPGNRTYLAAALSALSNNMTVTVVVSNTKCTNLGRPYLLAVSPSR